MIYCIVYILFIFIYCIVYTLFIFMYSYNMCIQYYFRCACYNLLHYILLFYIGLLSLITSYYIILYGPWWDDATEQALLYSGTKLKAATNFEDVQGRLLCQWTVINSNQLTYQIKP